MDIKKDWREMAAFARELQQLLNRHGIDNDLVSPDFVIADYVIKHLEVYRDVVLRRDRWIAPPPPPPMAPVRHPGVSAISGQAAVPDKHQCTESGGCKASDCDGGK